MYNSGEMVNPFPINKKTPDQEKERRRVLIEFKEYLTDQPMLLKQIPELKVKVLGCWCKPHFLRHSEQEIVSFSRILKISLSMVFRYPKCLPQILQRSSVQPKKLYDKSTPKYRGVLQSHGRPIEGGSTGILHLG
jgi:hypothetical protein